jgi:hypothetical protein
VNATGGSSALVTGTMQLCGVPLRASEDDVLLRELMTADAVIDKSAVVVLLHVVPPSTILGWVLAVNLMSAGRLGLLSGMSRFAIYFYSTRAHDRCHRSKWIFDLRPRINLQ